MKKLIIGLTIGLLLGMSTNAFAAIGDVVSATFARFNYVVNGSTKAIDSPVLVYEGTSYVRTTDIANMLGFDVTYKSDSRTIEFNNGATPSPTKAPISSLTVTDTTYTPTPDPNATPTPTPSDSPTPTPEPSATPSPTPTPTISPEPTPVPNYAGYNAALARLKAEVVDKNNKLDADFFKTYEQYKVNAPDDYQRIYKMVQDKERANNDQMELDILALKFQYNIPQSY
jgi:cell division septation protein DedD